MSARNLEIENSILRDALQFLFEKTKWKSVDKDNMEFEGRVTCYQLDRARTALSQTAPDAPPGNGFDVANRSHTTTTDTEAKR
jgi:hypothetical protein